MSWNHLKNMHFAGCVCLAQTYDTHRNRRVSVFALPGEFNLVGVSDGTDSWLAPVVADPFNVNIKKRLEEYAAGKPIPLSKPRRPLPANFNTPDTPSLQRRPRRALPTSF